MSPAEVLALAAKYLLDRGRLEVTREVAAAGLAEDARCAIAQQRHACRLR